MHKQNYDDKMYTQTRRHARMFDLCCSRQQLNKDPNQINVIESFKLQLSQRY